ncbi:hypothetical protein D1007_01405 [Hordeum vulgare]|nr:hypothetical protein D1007_01405 [Hordeum vulgare]
MNSPVGSRHMRPGILLNNLFPGTSEAADVAMAAHREEQRPSSDESWLDNLRDGGLLVLDPAAEALFGGMRHRKRARVTAVHPRVFAAAEEALRAAPAAKRQRLREAPTLDALPEGCLFEVLRRVQGARARGASSCISRRWLALLRGIRASEIKRAHAPAVPDLNQVFVCEDEDEDEGGAEAASARPGRSERTLEGEAATDVALTAAPAGLKAIGRYCSKLQAMNIKNCAYYGKAITNLTLTRLSSVGVIELALVSIAKLCPSLKQLYLRKYSQISDGPLKDFTEASKVLENLQIEECNRVTLTGILSFLLNCSPKFKALSLSKTEAAFPQAKGQQAESQAEAKMRRTQDEWDYGRILLGENCGRSAHAIAAVIFQDLYVRNVNMACNCASLDYKITS